MSCGLSFGQPKPLQDLAWVHSALPEAPLGEMLDILEQKFGIVVSVDEAAFVKLRVDKPLKKRVQLPSMMGVSREFVIEAIVQQMGGTVRTNGNTIQIVPGSRVSTSAGTHEPRTYEDSLRPR